MPASVQGLQTDAVEHKVERLRRVAVGRQRVMLAAVDEPFTKVSSNPSTLDAISGVDLGERVV
jgi:hypothetical protein